jgi:hypothetical protein
VARALTAGFIIALGIFTLLPWTQQSIAKTRPDDGGVTSEKANTQTILLQGFPALSFFEYTILSSTNLISEGSGTTGKDGTLVLSHQRPAEGYEKEIIYDFNISKNDQHIDMLVRLDLETGKMEFSGNGIEQFSDVTIITPERSVKTKSDWVGALVENGIQSDKSDKGFEIALHGFNGLADIKREQSPLIIKVLCAPGGGNRGSGGVNQFTTPCIPNAVPGVPLSVDDASHINNTISLIRENYIRALMMMTEQLSAVIMQSTLAIGMFMDAKIDMEVQRELQRGQAEAVKDYHPSDQMCQVGTFVRSVAVTEQKGVVDAHGLNRILMANYRNLSGSASEESAGQDIDARLKQFREVHCNLADNDEGLDYICEHDQDGNLSNSTAGSAAPGGIGGVDNERLNKDIDYFRTMEFPKTVDVDFRDETEEDEEKDIIALAKNLYWPTPATYTDPKRAPETYPGFLDMQSVIALKNIAHSSFSNLVGMKATAPGDPADNPGWIFMQQLMTDFGITEDDIRTMLGEQPSYWAQMEVLTKKMYQLPNFYTNLYNKPANIDRIEVALDAIKLMQLRDHYTSMLRREMLSSAMLQTELSRGKHYSSASSALTEAN